jgi:hypothetical protein
MVLGAKGKLDRHDGLGEKEKTKSFLARECWNDVQQATLGFVGLCRYWTERGVVV